MGERRTAIRILRRGAVVEIADVAPTETLLDYLRLRERATGTKEGCGEGDCGACTVAIGRPDGLGGVSYRPVNSCIQLLGMVDGAEVVTVEDLSADGRLHPIQQAFVDHHASQCGFCTPGFVMALFALFHRAPDNGLDRARLNDSIAGNLCRCTGYRPIVDAGLEACAAPEPDGFGGAETASVLATLTDDGPVFIGGERRFFAAPASEDALAVLYEQHPDAVLVAGATDVGLWITKQLRTIDKIIHIGRVRGMRQVHYSDDAIRIGAGATYADAWGALSRLDPDVAEVLRRLGSPQVRAVGTVGGNIANGSPIGDTPPLLIALGARITLRRGSQSRTIPLEDYFIEYGRQDRGPGEFLTEVSVPRPAAGTAIRAYKISKRFDQDISAVLAAFAFDIEAGQVRGARISFGGMAGIPKRARDAEAALKGAALDDPATWQAGIAALSRDFTPLDDHRASAAYRMQVAGNLLRKALTEVAGAPSAAIRVTGLREAAVVAGA